MNQENTKRLNDAFPKIFPQSFYFECGDGWFDLIYKTCKDIEAECVKLKVPDTAWPQASQIKEKYGTLRFYVTGAHSNVYDIIEAAEAASETLCEDCGAAGKERAGGWIHTTCDSCEAVRNKKG